MKTTFLRLLGYMGKYRKYWWMAVISALITVGCQLFAPMLVGMTMDQMAGVGQVSMGAVLKLLWWLLAIYGGSALFLWLLSYVTNRISYGTVYGLRNALFEKLSHLPLRFYDRHPHGDTMSRFINDVDAISDGMLQGLMALLQGSVTIIGAVAFMLHLHLGMALVVILSAPVAYLVARMITLASQKRFEEQAALLGTLNGYAEEMIQGQKTVKAFAYEAEAKEEFERINQKLYKTGVMAQFVSALSNPSTRIVNNLSYTAVGVLGALGAIAQQLSVGTVASFLIYAVLFAKPFNDITNVLTQMQAALASARRVFAIMDVAPESPDPKDAKTLTGCRGEVTMEDVCFSCEPDRPLLRHFSLHVPPGSKVAIVGHTGAGKTTLVNLLMRFYEVYAGHIYIDGVDTAHMSREGLRGLFGMVLQDTWLLEGSIRDNIAYARPGATMEEVVEAAQKAGAHGFIRRLEHGYDTRVSADGDSLSQGQKQLLTIARVLLTDPPMMILDEATSNIDPYMEQRIQKAFEKLTQGRTSFVIAHRLSTVRHADLILVMEQGQIVEQGTHEQLLSRQGVYAGLYQSQFAKSEEAGQ